MNPVIQEELLVVALPLAGITYVEAIMKANALGIYATDIALWSDIEYVRNLLHELGISVASKETPFKSWDQRPDRDLLAIKLRLEAGKPFWHLDIFFRDVGESVVLDSKKALKLNIRKYFGRIKPKWYIEVTK